LQILQNIAQQKTLLLLHNFVLLASFLRYVKIKTQILNDIFPIKSMEWKHKYNRQELDTTVVNA
jgi:hypothetical protein